MPIAYAMFMIGLTGLVCGAVLAAAARLFAVHEDPRVEALSAVLPGLNCGGCGLAGCGEYAKAVLAGSARMDLCGPGGPDTAEKVATFMGVAFQKQERRVALVRCGGDDRNAVRKFQYNGVADCVSAAAVGGGDKLCRYGCLGLGSCARVCPVGAIEITSQRLAVVRPEACIGCTRCVRTCPRNLIRMIPVSRAIHVLCSSRDKGPIVRQACKVGCIACTICTRISDGIIRMDGALAVVDYSKPLDKEELVAKCPGHCIVIIRVPKNA